mmetsp:Transcript_11730/g.33870  ORF Transcript_11730/g.33870 Transcript_11730/m.33870 type:complete len:402 (-) Transcript_11730:18-1223(-)
MRNCEMSDDVIGAATYCFGDYGVPAGVAPFMVQSMVQTHYDGGAFFPRGGAGSIGKAVTRAIQRRGGKVLVRAPVSKIVVNGVGRGCVLVGREIDHSSGNHPWEDKEWHTAQFEGADLVGVSPRTGGRAVAVECKGVRIPCKHGVISTAGAYNTFQKLLFRDDSSEGFFEAEEAEALRSCGAFTPSVQLMYAFVGLDQSDKELELPARNYWILHGWRHDENWKKFQDAKTFDELGFLPAIFLSFGSAKDDAHQGPASLQILAPVRYEWFEQWKNSKVKHRGKDYEQVKMEWKDRLLEELYRLFPQTRGHVTFCDVASPLTTNFYLNTTHGENYGLEHSLARFSLKAQRSLHTTTSISGLYLAGQDVFSVGVVAALASGFLTAVFLSPVATVWAFLEMILVP